MTGEKLTKLLRDTGIFPEDASNRDWHSISNKSIKYIVEKVGVNYTCYKGLVDLKPCIVMKSLTKDYDDFEWFYDKKESIMTLLEWVEEIEILKKLESISK